MLDIILDMIKLAEEEENLELISLVNDLIREFDMTFNAPSNWRGIREELVELYDKDSWVYSELDLYLYEED